MKALVFIFALSILILGSCTETIYDEIIKIDTVYLPGKTFAPTFITVRDTVHTVDTVSVEVIITETDTVYQTIVKDSIIIQEVEKIITRVDTVEVVIVERDTIVKEITLYDTVTLTVYDRTVVYLDTMYAVSWAKPVFSIPDDIIPHLEEFNVLCQQYGKQANLGVIIVQYVEELPGENWSSNSFQVAENSQIVIQLDQRHPAPMQRSSMLRELSRMGLGKKYSNDPDKIMSPLWSPEREIKKVDLDNLFQ